MMYSNPLLQPFSGKYGEIPYDKIELSHFIPAAKEAIRREEETIEKICNSTERATFANTIEPYERSSYLLHQIIQAFSALINSHRNEQMQEIEEELMIICTKHSNNITLNERLFERIKEAYTNDEDEVEGCKARLEHQFFRDFVRSGAMLKDDAREQYRKLCERLTLLGIKFEENIVTETDAYQLHVTNKEQLEGLPADLIASAAATAAEHEKDGWIFTLHRPSFTPFITYCRDRELRRQIYMAYHTRCANGGERDNRDIVKEIVNLRLQYARLLGYGTYSDYVVGERMAGSTDAVFAMLGKLTWSYLPAARNEVAAIEAYARETEGNDFDFQPWDFAYYAEKYKEQHYGINEEELREYLPLNQMILGLFFISTSLYGITFKAVDGVPTYHPDVTVYEVHDYDGTYLGLLYCDLYSRKGKHGGAWMDNLTAQYKENGKDHRPHVVLATNFRKPTPDNPTLLNFDELNTLLHEFGHCLHALCSDVTYATQSSPNVLWDFVELPSQIMENFTYHKQMLQFFVFHYKTGATLPDEIFERLLKSRNHLVAYQCIRQVSLGLIDQSWHNISAPFEGDVLEYEHSVKKSLQLLPVIKETGITPQFSHIMSGGYDAGYYSYKWAEMLDADAFTHFIRPDGKLAIKAIHAFRNEILAKGDTADPMLLYKRFCGRKPTLDALLKRDGMDVICPHL